jgi:ubiquinone/menaquinone biosynthesis C-methylase UbiE
VAIAFVCPCCRGALTHKTGAAEAYRCAGCERSFPVVLGIPDFRLEPDPWIGFEDDREKGRRLDAQTSGADQATKVRAYWAKTPGTPRELAEQCTAFVLGGEKRATEWLDGGGDRAPGPDGPWLEVGCGTGDLLAVVARRRVEIVGVDIAFRWLVVAQRRLREAGVRATLVCANGEHLPFADGSFSRVASLGTEEHCLDAQRLIAESGRVARSGGRVHFRTTNRYTPLPEPHVNVWGVGFVPRRWADAYVRWRNGQRYLHHRPLSRRELRRGLRRAGLARVRVEAAPLLAADRDRLARLAWAGDAYEMARRVPVVNHGLSWIAPLLEARGQVP